MPAGCQTEGTITLSFSLLSSLDCCARGLSFSCFSILCIRTSVDIAEPCVLSWAQQRGFLGTQKHLEQEFQKGAKSKYELRVHWLPRDLSL
eukprot:3937372-Rhodomonas_salina.2